MLLPGCIKLQWQTSLLFISYSSELSHIFSPVFQDKVVSVPDKIQEQCYYRSQYTFEEHFSCKPLIPATWKSENRPAVGLLIVAANFSFRPRTDSGTLVLGENGCGLLPGDQGSTPGCLASGPSLPVCCELQSF